MTIVAYKNRSSDLRVLLKIFKLRFDDLTILTRYEPALRRILYLGSNPQDQPWRAEAFHQLALMHQGNGDLDKAEKFYQQSLRSFKNYERLGTARTMRDYGLYVATYHDPKAGHAWANDALAMHDDDLNNAKGQRQRRLTESYVWRTALLVNATDIAASKELIEFALTDSRECSLRDQQQIITFALPYASGMDRQLLTARLIEVHAKRRKVTETIRSMAKLVIDTEILLVSKLISTVIRKE